ncbi:MAG: hypothetical protein ACR2H1_03320, partial [Limisphaerales bacterium]
VPEAATTNTVAEAATPIAPPEKPAPAGGKRIVTREGLVWKTISISAPTYYQLEHLENGKVTAYLKASDPKIFKPYFNKKVIVRGEELLDPRWPTIPIVEVESIALR